MHAYALHVLQDHLYDGASVLDVGSGESSACQHLQSLLSTAYDTSVVHLGAELNKALAVATFWAGEDAVMLAVSRIVDLNLRPSHLEATLQCFLALKRLGYSSWPGLWYSRHNVVPPDPHGRHPGVIALHGA